MLSLFISLLFHTCIAGATERTWPEHASSVREFFAPHWPEAYSDIEGLAPFGANASPIDKYTLISPMPHWANRSQCSKETRGSGYLQTLPTTNDLNSYLAKVATGISLVLNTHLNGLEKSNLLNKTLLTISILELDFPTFTLEPKSQFNISLRDICLLDANCALAVADDELPLQINYDGPILTPAFLFKKGQEIRIRVSWSAQGLCNEEFLDFKIGDQVRMIVVFPEN